MIANRPQPTAVARLCISAEANRSIGVLHAEFQNAARWRENGKLARWRNGADTDIASGIDGHTGSAVIDEEVQLVVADRPQPTAARAAADESSESDGAISVLEAVGVGG